MLTSPETAATRPACPCCCLPCCLLFCPLHLVTGSPAYHYYCKYTSL
jgi:hypothetical protein